MKKFNIAASLMAVLLFVGGCSAIPTTEASTEETTTTEVTTEEPTSEPTEATEQEETTEQLEAVTYEAGTYIVGTDIPAGEYVMFANTLGYVEVKSNDSIVASNFFFYNSITTLNEGEAVTFLDCYAAPYGTVDIDTSGEGMFKVGSDIPAGGYTIVSDNGFGDITIYSDNRFQEDSIVKDIDMEDAYWIEVEDGQYLWLQSCYIQEE